MELESARRTVEEELARLRRLTESSGHCAVVARLQDQALLRAADSFMKADTDYLNSVTKL